MTYYSAGCIEDALFANKVLPVLKEEYSKNSNIAFTIFPKTEQNDEFVGDPYQICTSLMAIKEMRVNCSVNFALDNQAIHDICQNSLKLETPKFDDYN